MSGIRGLVVASILVVVAVIATTAAASATSSRSGPTDPVAAILGSAHELGDAFACVAAPPGSPNTAQVVGLVLARRGDAHQTARDRARAVRLLRRLGLTRSVRLSSTSARFRASSMERVGRRLNAALGRRASHGRKVATDTAHCPPFAVALPASGAEPAVESAVARLVSRYGADRITVVRTAPGDAVPH